MELNPRVAGLISEGLLRDALALIESKSHPTLSERVVRVHLLAQAGLLQSADPVRELLGEHLTTSQRALCLETLSRSAGAKGDTVEALRYASEAVRVASSRDEASAIPYRAHYCRCLLHRVGLEAAFPELAKLRNAALRTGSPTGLIESHLISAEIEAKRAAFARAEVHLAGARALLDSHPHFVMLARWAQAKGHLATLTSAIDEAVVYGELCFEYSTKAGWSGVHTAVANLAHYHTRLGNARNAIEFLRKAATVSSLPLATRVALLCTEMELVLVAGESARASEIIEFAGRLSTSTSSEVKYYLLWFEVLRIRWLLDGGDRAEASEIASKAVHELCSFGDDNLRQRLNVLTAECLLTAGSGTSGALELFEDAFRPDRTPSLELAGAWSKVVGQWSGQDQTAAVEHFKRAARIFAWTTDLSGLVQVSRAARAAGFAGWDDSPVADTARRDAILRGPDDRFRLREPDSRSPVVASLVIQNSAAMFDLVGHPLLAAYEVLCLAFESGAATAGVAIEKTPNAAPRVISSFGHADALTSLEEQPNAVRFDIGMTRGQSLEVVVLPSADAAARITLIALRRLLHSARALHEARRNEVERTALWPDETPEQQLGMIFASENMSELVNIVRRVATSNVTVLFSGESGTGKELLARALHETSPRREKPFVPFNCTAVARDMLDSQLFGYRRGAFTGAQEAFPGVIRAAAGGTLLLDEIGELGLDVQPKLLRFLESGEVHPLGEPRPITVDVRVVAATNANLEQLVADGRFREDLFYRLNVVRLQVPALRERREEIPLLAQHFLDKFSRESDKTGLRFAEETMEYLVLYSWPGNVRQLANEIRRLVALAESAAILMPEHLSSDIASSRRTIPSSQRAPAPTEFVVRMDQPLSAAFEHLERSMIQYALKHAAGRVEEAAQLLGISRKGLYLKRQRLHLDEPLPAEKNRKEESARESSGPLQGEA